METKRLLIRPLEAQDIEALYTVLSDEAVMRYIETPFSRKQTAEFIQHVNAAEPPLAHAVVWKENNTVIGHLIYHPYDAESWELGWILHCDYWHKGISDELTTAVIADAQRREIPELVIECDPNQTVTRHIAEKHGFRYMGEENNLAIYQRTIKRSVHTA